MSHGQHCDKKYSKTFELPDLLNFSIVIIPSTKNSKHYTFTNHLKSKKLILLILMIDSYQHFVRLYQSRYSKR